MASNFITAQEVIDIAFERKNTNATYISDSAIEVAEEGYVLPVLGQDLYDRLNTDNGNLTAEEVALKARIKTALAYYVKFVVYPDMCVQLGNKGAQVMRTDYSQAATNQDKGNARETARNNGDVLMSKAVRYIEDNEDKFPTYKKSGNVKNRIKRRGGLIL